MKKLIRVYGKWLALGLWIVAAGLCSSCGQDAGELLIAESEDETWSTQAVQPEETTQAAVLYVHVCGAVRNPGVYKMQEGQRVFEAVEAAGGFSEEADESWLNLAELVSDGMKVEVLTRQQAEEWQVSGQESGKKTKINLNLATKEQLMTLRGIGEARAEDIIRYRTEHGKFEKIEDIMQISGIKESAFEKIKEDITV